jgi:hypothetical protein
MTTHLRPGAFLRGSKTFVKADAAEKYIDDKKNEWICPSCETPAILCKGSKVPPYFRHPSGSTCSFFEGGESEQHLGAKKLAKVLLESERSIIFTRSCRTCSKDVNVFEINTRVSNTRACIEYRFRIEETEYSADVALLEGDSLQFIWEVYWTHRTSRPTPEPWVDVRASHILESDTTGPLSFRCLREHTCARCVEENIRRENLAAEAAAKWKREAEEAAAKRKREAEELATKRRNAEEKIRQEKEARLLSDSTIEALDKSIQKGYIENAQRIINNTPNFLNLSIRGMSILQLACVSGKKEMVDWLVNEKHVEICKRSITLSEHQPEILQILKRFKAQSAPPPSSPAPPPTALTAPEQPQ